MLYQALADLVVLIHLGFIVFALLGGLLALWWRWLPWAHLPAVAWGAAIELSGWPCPLTPLESWLRRAGHGQGYSGDFIERYVTSVVYPSELTREVQLLLGAGLVIFNVVVYCLVWRRRRHPRRRDDGC